jgi:hypothetical protein
MVQLQFRTNAKMTLVLLFKFSFELQSIWSLSRVLQL